MSCAQVVQTHTYTQKPNRLGTPGKRLRQQLFVTAQIPSGSGLLQSCLSEVVKLHFDEGLAGPVLPFHSRHPVTEGFQQGRQLFQAGSQIRQIRVVGIFYAD